MKSIKNITQNESKFKYLMENILMKNIRRNSFNYIFVQRVRFLYSYYLYNNYAMLLNIVFGVLIIYS